MLRGERIYLRSFVMGDAEARLQLQLENRNFFEAFAMARSSDFYTLEAQEQLIESYAAGQKNDLDYHFGIFLQDSDALIGTINLFQVLRGSLQSAFIGYFLHEEYNGKGYTTEAVKLLVNYAFEKLNLHRIEAGVMPHNVGSIRVLEKSGFHKEGLAIKNVKINGKWEDHQLLAIINPAD